MKMEQGNEKIKNLLQYSFQTEHPT